MPAENASPRSPNLSAASPAGRLRFQLALQGGGARFVDLMAVLSALQELRHVIEITRIAGTSAGSLAGCLFAAQHNMEDLWRRLCADQKVSEILASYKAPSRTSFLWHFLRHSSPLWDTTSLSTYLHALFEEKKKSRLRQLDPEVRVIATDLRGRRCKVHDKTHDAAINHAILDSCGLPFLFRGWRKDENAELLVDGGLCENLPVESLLDGDEDLGPVIAVTFKPTDQERAPVNFLSFAYSLLEAAINHSVSRAVLHHSVAHVCEVETSLRTLDFTKALNTGYWSEFKRIRDDTINSLQGMLSARRHDAPLSAKTRARKDPLLKSLLETNFLIYHTAFASKHVTYEHVILEAITYEPHGSGDQVGEPDLMRIEELFTPQEDIQCLWYNLDYNDDYLSLGTTDCTLHEEHGSRRKIEIVKVSSMSKGSPGILLFCAEPLRSNVSYRIRIYERGHGLLRPLFKAGKDTLAYQIVNKSRSVRLLDFILVHRAELPVRMVSSPNSQLAGEPLPEHLFHDGVHRAGRQMKMKGLGIRFDGSRPLGSGESPRTFIADIHCQNAPSA